MEWPQVQGGINSPLPFIISCCGHAVRSMMRSDIPNTSGLFRPMNVIAPEASILNSIMPAASSMRGIVGFKDYPTLFLELNPKFFQTEYQLLVKVVIH